MAGKNVEGGSEAAVAYALWSNLLEAGYAPDVQDKAGALALFRECMEAVRHTAIGSLDIQFVSPDDAKL